jgi:hypothetical protein
MAMRLALPVLVSFLVACGGGSPPPPASATADQPDAAASAADAGGGASDEIKPFAGVDLGEPPPAASGSAAASAAPPPPPAERDDCTPVGVDFEKRARPKLKECYREGKKKNPALEGTVRIAVAIDTLGKIKSIKIVEKTLPDPVANCMLGAVKKTPFPEASKCPGKDITIPVTFPTPH